MIRYAVTFSLCWIFVRLITWIQLNSMGNVQFIMAVVFSFARVGRECSRGCDLERRGFCSSKRSFIQPHSASGFLDPFTAAHFVWNWHRSKFNYLLYRNFLSFIIELRGKFSDKSQMTSRTVVTCKALSI